MTTPVLTTDAASLKEDASVIGNVLQNDSGAVRVTQIKLGANAYAIIPPEGLTLSGIYGSLIIQQDGSYSYAATTSGAEGLKRAQVGTDTFTYDAASTNGTTASTTLKFTVTGINDAPVITTSSWLLKTITEDQFNTPGQSVATFLKTSDVDANAVRGAALTTVSTDHGAWQYSLDAGVTWLAVGSVSETSALLLRSTDLLRFVPDGENGTTASLSYRAWDQTSGTLGSKVNASVTGGETAFSTATGTASLTVTPVNDAPVAEAGSATGTVSGPPITGQVHASDVDLPAQALSYALVPDSAVGGTVTLDATSGNYEFTPNAGFTGPASFQFSASDGTATSAPAAISITLQNPSGTNAAPVLTSQTETLPTITEDQISNGGASVASFLHSTDADANAMRGLALTGLASGNGQWQYSTDGGTTWAGVGAVAEDSALLLRSNDYVRFVPDGNNGTSATLNYRAWDQTSGTYGTKADATVAGGATAFSTDFATASLTVSSVNDAPVASAGTASGTEDGPAVTGQLRATDVDSSTLTYALVANSASGGTVTLNATTGNYSFTPAANFNGDASFRFTASDGSATSAAATVTIGFSAVNDVPIAVNDSATTNRDVPVLVNVLANDSDVDADTLSITTLGTASHGVAVIENGQVRYTPTTGYTGSDSFTYSISDGAGGTDQATAAITIQAPAAPTAFSVTFSQGANGYSSAIDTTLKENRSTTTYGDAIVLRPGAESGHIEQSLLKFGNLFGSGPGQIPVGATIVSAVLQLQVTGDTSAGGTINRMLTSWSESSTWSSLGNGVQINGVEATSAGAITVGAVALGPKTFNVTSDLAAWNGAASTSSGQNAANLGWLFNPTSTNPWDFTSTEGAVKPVLSVSYTLNGSTAAALPAVSITAGSPAIEGGAMSYTLTLSQAAAQDVTVTYSTNDFTAKAGTDYVDTTRTVTFTAGETSKNFTVPLVNDSAAERSESFTVQIDSATNATIKTAVAIGRIIDNDVSVPAMPALTPSIVASYNIYDGSKYKDGGSGAYGISDPSGLAYIPSLGRLLVADSEHDESPFSSSTNLFSLRLDGSYAARYSLNSFTKEPTGLGYNANNGYLYIADDDKYAVSWVSPSNLTVRLGSFDTMHLGFMDTEDLKIDPVTGNIHILDGTLKQMIELTDKGSFVNSTPLPAVMTDAEALAYDPLHDLYFVASGASRLIWILDPQGQIQGTIDLFSSYSHFHIKGMEYAPSSNPNDGNMMSLYIADYGNDQQNDGRLFEVHLGDWFS